MNSLQVQKYYGCDIQKAKREADRICYGKLKGCGEIETDQESTGSSEDMESPRSVAKVRTWPMKNVNVRVHSQVLKIREEELHLGEDKVGGHHVDVLLFPRPILPASPLGGKTAIKIVH